MSKKKPAPNSGVLNRVGRAWSVWLRSARWVILLVVVTVPVAAWSWRGVQLAGTSVPAQLWWTLVNVVVHIIGGSCTISAMDAARAGKQEWLSRGLRRAPRVLGWELLVTFQAAIRTFIPFLPPSANQPPEYQPRKGSLAWWLDRLPLFAGASYFLSKMGLRPFVAILSKKPLQHCAAVSRGHYLHIGLLNFIAATSGLIGFGIMSNVQKAAGGPGHLPAWGTLFAILFAELIGASLLTAYGLMLYHDCRKESID